MSDFVNTIDVLGDAAVLDSIVDGSIVEFKDNVLTKVGEEGLNNRTVLKTIDLPNVTLVDEGGFSHCIALESVNLPKCEEIKGGAFSNDSTAVNALTKMTLPVVRKIGDRAFRMNAGIEILDLPSATSLGNQMFQYCKSLRAIILRSETQCSLGYNAFDESSVKNGGTGLIYVPRALLENYKSASYWSLVKNQFRALEDYTLDGTVTGELNENHIDVRKPIEIPDDWATIMSACADGSYIQKYKVGDWKPLDLGDEGTVNMQIVARDTDVLADGSGTAAVTWIAKELLSTKKRMNPSLNETTVGTGGIGGWEHSELRSYLRDTVLLSISNDIRNAIVEVRKTQSAYDTTESLFDQETVDNVWIPSKGEVYGSERTYINLFSSASERIKYTQSGSNTAWWLRDAYSTANYSNVTGGGGISQEGGSKTLHIALGFCTGVTK